MTRNVLPRVTQAVANAAAESVHQNPRHQLVQKLDQMQEENPVVYAQITAFIAAKYAEGHDIQALTIVAVTVYELLRSQAEADVLTEMFSQPAPATTPAWKRILSKFRFWPR